MGNHLHSQGVVQNAGSPHPVDKEQFSRKEMLILDLRKLRIMKPTEAKGLLSHVIYKSMRTLKHFGNISFGRQV